ncbi:dTDP-4-dehydrorhamnose reductase, partial [mine drainage metagenome]
GISGLVGSRLAELQKDYEVYGTYNTHEVNKKNYFKLDTIDREATFKLIERINPRYIIDTHAISNVDYCELHPEEAWRVNVDGVRNVAEASKKYAAKYVFFSTDYVFDGRKFNYTEKDKPMPLNYYAKTKLAAEYMLSALDINHITIRTAVIYGSSGMNKVSFPLWAINKLKGGENVKVVADQYNKPTLADNLIDFMMRLCKKDETGIFHVTGSELINRYDFARLVAKTFGFDENKISAITSAELNQIARRPESVNLSTEKAERVTKIKPIGVKEGLKILREQIGDIK